MNSAQTTAGAISNQHPSYVASHRPKWLLVGFWICIVIAVAAVIRRLAALVLPSHATSQGNVALDSVFASHAALTIAHIVPAMLFVLLTPFVLLRRANDTRAERLLFPLGAVVGATAYAMSAYSIGGWVERSAVLLFNTLFLYSLARAYGFMRAQQHREKRIWMIRAIAILLGIATTRPVMGVFFATMRLTHLQPAQFFGLAFWIGFSINTIAVQLWLRPRERQSQTERMAARSTV